MTGKTEGRMISGVLGKGGVDWLHGANDGLGSRYVEVQGKLRGHSGSY